MRNLLTSLLLLLSTIAYSQSTTITPGAVLPQMTSAQRTGLANPVNGMMVYDLGTSSYWFYQNTAWAELPKAGSTSNYWELNGLNGNEIKNTNSGGFWSANQTGLTTSSSSTSNPPTAPISGNGTRMMWIPSRSAFRVGTVTSGTKSWDADSVGLFSTAFGYNVKAKGKTSTALGNETTASGFLSTALGDSTHAYGPFSVAMGQYSSAGYNSTSMGYACHAGLFSTAMGNFTKALGFSSTSSGAGTLASGDYSTAMGTGTTASGYASSAFGRETFAKASGGTSIGNFSNNTDSPSPTIPSSIDRIFQIGNGSGSSTRSNAMTVLRNANTGINTATPDAMLHVNGFTKLGDDAPNIKVKKLSGTTSTKVFPSDPGVYSVILPHGIGNADKIIGVDIQVENLSGQWTPGWYDASPNYRFNYYLDNTNIHVINKSSESSVIAGRPLRVLIIYEE